MNVDMQPGWYSDPSSKQSQLRYWDGDSWTEMVQGQAPQRTSLSVEDALKMLKELLTAMLLLSLTTIGIVVSVVPLIIIIVIVFAIFGGEIAGTTVIGFMSWLLMVAVILAFVYNGILSPIWLMFKNYSLKKTCRTFTASATEYEDWWNLSYAIRFLNTTTTTWIVGTLASAILAFMLHDLMMSSMGNPWTGLLTLGILIIGKAFLFLLFAIVPYIRLEKENQVMFAEMKNLWKGDS